MATNAQIALIPQNGLKEIQNMNKFNINDEVYIIGNNEIRPGIVCKIEGTGNMKMGEKTFYRYVQYDIFIKTQSVLNVPEEKVFKTKEELVDFLLK